MEHVTPKQERAMYTVASATSKHVRYAYDPGHPDADENGHVTMVTLAWDQDFIATAMSGRMLYDEACILAACEMNSTCTAASPLVKDRSPLHPASTSDILARALVLAAERKAHLA